ncbi:MAG: pyridoxamine 5'-phosphate oxidase [Balneola sp.]
MKTKDIEKLREEYSQNTLDEKDVDLDPVAQFQHWLNESLTAKIPEPNAMTLSTVDSSHKPHSRIVLLKGIDKGSFIFYSNYKSDKGKEMDSNPNVALCFLWKELERQVRIEGTVTKLSREESEEYFHVRPVQSQIGAIASEQSLEIDNRAILETKFEELLELYSTGHVPMPDFWGGYIVEPTSIEFWQGRRSRLHDRIKYKKSNNSWTIKRLSP